MLSPEGELATSSEVSLLQATAGINRLAQPWFRLRIAEYIKGMSEKPRRKGPSPQGKRGSEPYEALDGEWCKIGLAAPARQALVDAKLFKVSVSNQIPQPGRYH